MYPAPPELDALSLIVAVPMRVPFPRAIAAFSLGEVHSLILTTDGEVWSFGDGSFGATCNVTEPFHSRVVPEQFGLCELGLHEGERIVSLVAGAFHSTVLTSDDRVLVWGDNTHGQLGSSPCASKSKRVRSVSNSMRTGGPHRKRSTLVWASPMRWMFRSLFIPTH